MGASTVVVPRHGLATTCRAVLRSRPCNGEYRTYQIVAQMNLRRWVMVDRRSDLSADLSVDAMTKARHSRPQVGQRGRVRYPKARDAVMMSGDHRMRASAGTCDDQVISTSVPAKYTF